MFSSESWCLYRFTSSRIEFARKEGVSVLSILRSRSPIEELIAVSWGGHSLSGVVIPSIQWWPEIRIDDSYRKMIPEFDFSGSIVTWIAIVPTTSPSRVANTRFQQINRNVHYIGEFFACADYSNSLGIYFPPLFLHSKF